MEESPSPRSNLAASSSEIVSTLKFAERTHRLSPAGSMEGQDGKPSWVSGESRLTLLVRKSLTKLCVSSPRDFSFLFSITGNVKQKKEKKILNRTMSPPVGREAREERLKSGRGNIFTRSGLPGRAVRSYFGGDVGRISARSRSVMRRLVLLFVVRFLQIRNVSAKTPCKWLSFSLERPC